MIEIREVKSKKDLKTFATFPVKLYKNCPYYVPSIRGDEMGTFNPKKNFSLERIKCKGFLAFKDGKAVGRIAGLINEEYNKIKGQKFIRFSRIECIDDADVFKALLGAVENYGAENGLEIIHGPWGFNDTDREGTLTFGFDKRSTYATNYSYPYFTERIRELGFCDESKWEEKNFVIPKVPYEKITEISERLVKKYQLHDVAKEMSIKKVIKFYGDKWFETYNEAYSTLDGFVPVSENEKKNILKQFATIINPRYFSILVDKKGDVAAFGIVLPSICKPLIKHKGKLCTGFIGVLHAIKHPKELEMALIGIKSEYKNSGVNAIVIAHILNNVVADGIERIESNPMLITNLDIQQQWKFAEGEVVKKRQTFVKPIGDLRDYYLNEVKK